MGGLAASQGHYHSPGKPSPPSLNSSSAHPPLTIGGREIDGHREVDLGPRRGRTAGKLPRQGQGFGEGEQSWTGCGKPGLHPARRLPVCGLSIWDSDASHALPPGLL